MSFQDIFVIIGVVRYNLSVISQVILINNGVEKMRSLEETRAIYEERKRTDEVVELEEQLTAVKLELNAIETDYDDAQAIVDEMIRDQDNANLKDAYNLKCELLGEKTDLQEQVQDLQRKLTDAQYRAEKEALASLKGDAKSDAETEAQEVEEEPVVETAQEELPVATPSEKTTDEVVQLEEQLAEVQDELQSVNTELDLAQANLTAILNNENDWNAKDAYKIKCDLMRKRSELTAREQEVYREITMAEIRAEQEAKADELQLATHQMGSDDDDNEGERTREMRLEKASAQLEDWATRMDPDDLEMQERKTATPLGVVTMPNARLSEIMRDSLVYDLHFEYMTVPDASRKYGIRHHNTMRSMRNSKWYQKRVARVVKDGRLAMHLPRELTKRLFNGEITEFLASQPIGEKQEKDICLLAAAGISDDTLKIAYGLTTYDLIDIKTGGRAYELVKPDDEPELDDAWVESVMKQEA